MCVFLEAEISKINRASFHNYSLTGLFHLISCCLVSTDIFQWAAALISIRIRVPRDAEGHTGQSVIIVPQACSQGIQAALSLSFNMPHTCWQSCFSAGHLHFLLTVLSVCRDNDAPQMSLLCFLKMIPLLPENLSVSAPLSLLARMILLLLQLSALKCNYVQVSAPAIRDDLTFYCALGLFSRQASAATISSAGCFIVVLNVSIAAHRRDSCSADHFSFLLEAGSVRPNMVNTESQHVKHYRNREEVSLSL